MTVADAVFELPTPTPMTCAALTALPISAPALISVTYSTSTVVAAATSGSANVSVVPFFAMVGSAVRAPLMRTEFAT